MDVGLNYEFNCPDTVATVATLSATSRAALLPLGSFALLVAACAPAKDPRISGRDQLIGCMKKEDYRCIVNLTPKEERESVGFKRPEDAEAFLRYAFKEIGLEMKAEPSTDHTASNFFPAVYPYSTASTPKGEFLIDVSETDEGAVVTHLYGTLVLAVATDVGVANGYGTRGPAKLRGWAFYFRREGANLERRFGMKGTYELGSKTFRTWSDLAADMERRADRAEGLATPAR